MTFLPDASCSMRKQTSVTLINSWPGWTGLMKLSDLMVIVAVESISRTRTMLDDSGILRDDAMMVAKLPGSCVVLISKCHRLPQTMS